MVMLRARREMSYMTRMLRPGDAFEATPVDARFLLGDESAEEVDDAPRGRRGKPPEEVSAPFRSSAGKASDPEPVVVADDSKTFEDRTVGELREMSDEREPITAAEEPSRDDLLKMVAQRGIELPPGYVTKPELLKLLQGAADAG